MVGYCGRCHVGQNGREFRVAQNKLLAFGGGTIIGSLGGLIGLGGAEFRLPLLIGAFRFAALEAVILNRQRILLRCSRQEPILDPR
ncbi:hypothetical protein A9174_10520 [Mesorhizobium loti NZP2037]|nr:hypothetical protein A9174_10520 [Mesorhizobium loti NZP2037]